MNVDDKQTKKLVDKLMKRIAKSVLDDRTNIAEILSALLSVTRALMVDTLEHAAEDDYERLRLGMLQGATVLIGSLQMAQKPQGEVS